MQLGQLQKLPFGQIIEFIDHTYDCTPTSFINGSLNNESYENQGSAKILYFGQLNQLSKEETLKLFAEHYEAVLNDREGNSHQNIRNFMLYGWERVSFFGVVLKLK